MQAPQDQSQPQPAPPTPPAPPMGSAAPAAQNIDLDKSPKPPVYAPDDETTRPIEPEKSSEPHTDAPDDETTLPILPEQTAEKPEQTAEKKATGQPVNVSRGTTQAQRPAAQATRPAAQAPRRLVRIQRRPKVSKPSFSFTMILFVATTFIASFLIGLGYLHYKNTESEAKENRSSIITFDETPAKNAVIPSKHNCRVRGKIPGYGRYTLVFEGSKGQVCTSVPYKKGRLTDVHYNKKTGLLTATCIWGENVAGYFSGTLTKEHHHFVYRGTFTTSKDVDIDFIMVSK